MFLFTEQNTRKITVSRDRNTIFRLENLNLGYYIVKYQFVNQRRSQPDN